MKRGWVVAVAIALLAPIAAEGQSWKSVTMSRQLENSDEVHVAVEYGAGRFIVRSIDEDLLYRMNLRYDEDKYEPVADFTGDRLRLGVESNRGGVNIRGREAGELELELARGVPMDLELKFGAVQAEIDLGGLALTNLELSTGASESLVDISEPNPLQMNEATFEAGAAEFTVHGLGNLNAERITVDAGIGAITLGLEGRWKRDAELDIQMGLGSLELLVPEGLGIRLRKDSFLASLDSEGLIKRGDVYESPDFADAEHRVVIDLDAAFGSIAVIWVR